MLFKVIKVVISLALLSHYIEGFERVIVVTESFATTDDSLSNDDKDNISTSTIRSGSSYRDLCCVYGNCSCSSLFTILNNLTSNVLINITTDVQLHSTIRMIDLTNIAITGHNNPTINCNNSGGLIFISCYNCRIEGIIWKNCGATNTSAVDHNVYPVLQLANSSNITIQNCSFKQSIGQAIVLSGMSGDVNINYCSFLYNKQCEDHGTAIHYSSNSILRKSPFKFMINSCNFFHNGILKNQSIVYFGQPSTTQCEYFIIKNSKFHYNKGVPVYLCNKQDLHIIENAEFFSNVAENGGGIFISDHSTVIFHNSTVVNFTNNRVNTNGGAIFLTDHSSILFNDLSTSYCHDSKLRCTLNEQYPTKLYTVATFYGNKAIGRGQDVYAYKSTIIVGNDAIVTVGSIESHQSGISAMFAAYCSTVTFKGNSRVTFINNTVEDYGSNGVMSAINSTIKFEGNSTIRFANNLGLGNGGAMYIDDHSTVSFEGNSTVTFDNNAANNGGAVFIEGFSVIRFVENSTVIYNNNVANQNDGGALYINESCTIAFKGNSTVAFNNNKAVDGGAVYIEQHSTITYEGNSTVTFINNKANSKGGVMYIYYSSTITFKENSTVIYNNNIARHNNGGAVYTHVFCTLSFEGNPTVIFNNNEAFSNGAAVYMDRYSVITFEGTPTVDFINNKAYGNGGAVYIDNYCAIIFEGSSTVTFDNNKAISNGGAMFIYYSSNITFEGDSLVIYNDNEADHNNGGTMYVEDHCTITFKGNSTVAFRNNEASSNGGAMYIRNLSMITFEENSSVTYNDNEADHNNGGAVCIDDHCTITFKGNSTVVFRNNEASSNGGAMYIYHSSTVTFEENSSVTYNSNVADYNNGGAVYVHDSCAVTFEGNSLVKFYSNAAEGNGGAIFVNQISITTFKEYSTVTFDNNKAISNGGAMFIHYSSNITFEGDSLVIYNDNEADHNNGGAVCIDDHCTITFKGNSTVVFRNNEASSNGGAMYIYHSSTVTFEENSSVTYNSNVADYNNGGAVYIRDSCAVTFEGNSLVKFYSNAAEGNGGAIFVNQISITTFKEYSTVTFHNNTANSSGGAFYMDGNSTARYTENSTVVFNSNTGGFGGSVFSKYSSINIEGCSLVNFFNNTAFQDGGAICLSDHSDLSFLHSSTVNLNYNIANDYGRAIFILFEGSKINFESPDVYFQDSDTGSIQKPVYINVPKSCDSTCLLHSLNIANKNFSQLTTSPRTLVLYNPAKCIHGNGTYCHTYYMNNIMLGQDVTFDACVVDYYDQQTEATQFIISGMNHQDYNISGSKYITISCSHTTQGIAIIGNLHSNTSYNYSMTISLYVTRASESKVISINLTVELSQCYPGFWHSTKTYKCECYNIKNIISCIGSNSTIKRGYWFGKIKGQPTLTYCPNNYCNFTCCEITNGIYHLSPVRANQCRLHRSGTACGDCEKGFTLSFDSNECVKISKCKIGQTVLVITLSLLYWIAVVVAVFAMMYFKVTVGSLYAIIYYYSVIDILLSQVLFISNGLYTTVNIVSSLAKLTPQFLGQLCLVQNMSGIDQQFIHYVHPTVISLILIMIIMLARRSRRVSSFVSRGIIHFICFLLLLSYTSVATTSLLLMRPLTFIDVDQVYTYLSPDIKYFHGRHLVYVIPAVILLIIIVTGFPLLLLLEPFLNSRINFIKIKPLLDQFQGCYKDKYRCFAGYYMICRLVIILLVIVKISDDFINQYILISSCALMQLIHVLVQPYVSTFHNVFDGIILQLIVIISGLPVVEFVDSYDETFVLVIAYLLVVLPLAGFIVIGLWVNKNSIQHSLKDLRQKCLHKCTKIFADHDDVEEPIEANEITGITVDDSVRKNATVVDV